MRFGSVCSGIEAASVAWHPLGWKAAWLAEIEPFPSAVLQYHYADVPNLGDMAALPERILNEEIEAPDLFCGGTPCQAFSVAGLRKSLDDARGNLSLTFCEIANAIDNVRAVRGDPPAIVFWENVPGVLSTKDNAFGCFLAGLAGEDDPIEPPGGKWTNSGCVYGPSRTVAWRILDAQYFGVAQRRRRVFVVASAREDFDPAAVLFEREGVRRDSPPSREAREETTHSTAPCLTSSGRGVERTGDTRGQDPVVAVCPTLRAGGNQTGGDRPPGTDVDTADSLIITMAHGQGGAEIAHDRSPTLTCIHEAPIAAYGIAGNIIGREPHNGGNGLGFDEEISYMLTKTDRHGVAQPIAWDEELNPSVDVAETILRGGAGGRHDGVAQPMAFAQNTRDEVRYINGDGAIAGALAAESGMKQTNYVHQSMAVRRLTPVECERLQGFPDNYTNIPWRKQPIAPDGPRYKALGNSWAVPVVRWIGQRIHNAVVTGSPICN